MLITVLKMRYLGLLRAYGICWHNYIGFYFDINIAKEKVYYKQIFNPANSYSDDFKSEATVIVQYIILNKLTIQTMRVNGEGIMNFLIVLGIK